MPATSLFGIACSRQLDSSLLIDRPPEVTRSTVQKAVVVVTDSPQRVGQLREKLSVVTSAWFAQRYVSYARASCAQFGRPLYRLEACLSQNSKWLTGRV